MDLGLIDGQQFPLGRIEITDGAEDDCDFGRIIDCLTRHAKGDWGCLPDEDKRANDERMRGGARLLSAYPIDPARPCRGFGENTLWISTAGNRSVTTVLLPTEY